MKHEIFEDWTAKEWYGNPDLVKEAMVKTFKNQHNSRKVPIWIWRGSLGYSFTVRAGANSEYSYTGSCVDCDSLDQCKLFIEQYYKSGRLFR